MRDEVGMCGPEHRDRLGDDGRPTRYLRVEGRGLSTALLVDSDGRRIGIVDARYADLLAAAPELLAALKALMAHANAYSDSMREIGYGSDELGSHADSVSLAGMVRATIAKAEGR